MYETLWHLKKGENNEKYIIGSWCSRGEHAAKKEETAEVAADCGKVVIGEMNWASGEFLARLDGLVMKSGYECELNT